MSRKREGSRTSPGGLEQTSGFLGSAAMRRGFFCIQHGGMGIGWERWRRGVYSQFFYFHRMDAVEVDLRLHIPPPAGGFYTTGVDAPRRALEVCRCNE